MKDVLEVDIGYVEKQSNEVLDESFFEKSKEEESLEINGTVTVVTSPVNFDRKSSPAGLTRKSNKLGLIQV